MNIIHIWKKLVPNAYSHFAIHALNCLLNRNENRYLIKNRTKNIQKDNIQV